MGQILATVFLIVIAAGVLKMVADVQIAKLEHIIDDLKKHFNEN